MEPKHFFLNLEVFFYVFLRIYFSINFDDKVEENFLINTRVSSDKRTLSYMSYIILS